MNTKLLVSFGKSVTILANRQRSFVDDLAFRRGCKFSSWLSSTRNWDLSCWMVLIIDYKFLVLFRVSAILTEYQDLKIKNRELVDVRVWWPNFRLRFSRPGVDGNWQKSGLLLHYGSSIKWNCFQPSSSSLWESTKIVTISGIEGVSRCNYPNCTLTLTLGLS